MILNAEVLRQPLKRGAELLSIVPDHIGMGCAQHNVKNIGMLLHDSRQSADHMVNSLVLRDQAKGQQYSTSGKPEARLETIGAGIGTVRSEENTSELQSLMRTSYAVFCLKKKNYTITTELS